MKHDFNASLELVWQEWATAQLLEQWWGLKPWKTPTKTMDFREGAFWHYAMVSPEGEKHWSKTSYISIVKEKSFTAIDGFCDEDRTMNPAFPQNLCNNNFSRKEIRYKLICYSLSTRLPTLKKLLK